MQPGMQNAKKAIAVAGKRDELMIWQCRRCDPDEQAMFVTRNLGRPFKAARISTRGRS